MTTKTSSKFLLAFCLYVSFASGSDDDSPPGTIAQRRARTSPPLPSDNLLNVLVDPADTNKRLPSPLNTPSSQVGSPQLDHRPKKLNQAEKLLPSFDDDEAPQLAGENFVRNRIEEFGQKKRRDFEDNKQKTVNQSAQQQLVRDEDCQREAIMRDQRLGREGFGQKIEKTQLEGPANWYQKMAEQDLESEWDYFNNLQHALQEEQKERRRWEQGEQDELARFKKMQQRAQRRIARQAEHRASQLPSYENQSSSDSDQDHTSQQEAGRNASPEDEVENIG